MTDAQRDTIHQIWDELADFPVAETDRAQAHLMQRLAALVRSSNANWVGAVRLDATQPGDPFKGFRPRAKRYLHSSPEHEAAYQAQAARWNRNEPNEGAARAVRDAGSFRSFRLRAAIRPGWLQEEYYQTFLASRGFHDQLFVFFPLNQDYESMFGFQRNPQEPDFTAEEEALASYALRGIKWFHRQLAMSYGLLIAERPLTEIQRQILKQLLTERSEKQIADELGKPLASPHKHITEIFRKYDVNSRAGLMSLWLGQKP